MKVLEAFGLAILKPEVISIFTVTLKFQILLYFDFNISIIPSEIPASLCCAIHGSINSKCASRERRGSKHDEGLRKIYSEKRKEAQRERERERQRRETKGKEGREKR